MQNEEFGREFVEFEANILPDKDTTNDDADATSILVVVLHHDCLLRYACLFRIQILSAPTCRAP